MLDGSVSRSRLWFDALRGFYRRQLPIEQLDGVSRWLYAGRFLILVISAQAALIAALLAAPSGRMNPWFFLPLIAGYLVAHAISNFSNDYFGFIRGHDTSDSPRVTYTIHPLAHGVLTKRALATGLLTLCFLGIAIDVFFVVERGYLAGLFFCVGAALLVLYDAAPKSLKAIGLGELAGFVVWGPLMVGAGYYCLTGQLQGGAAAVGVPYGLGIAGILLGKHIDQAPFDRMHAIRTLPVLIGERRARRLNQSLVVLSYLLVALLVVLRELTPFALVVFLNAGAAWRLLRACSQERPVEAPPGYIGWPLWFHRFNLVHNRRFGWFYILGIGLGALASTVGVGLNL